MIYLLSEIRDTIEKIFKALTASDSEILHIQTQESLDGYKEFDQQLNDKKEYALYVSRIYCNIIFYSASSHD